MQVERDRVSVFRAPGGFILGQYPDGSLLVHQPNSTRLARVHADGAFAWTTRLEGIFTAADAAIDGDDTWLLGTAEARLSLTAGVAWTQPQDGSVTGPLVLARLDSQSGQVRAAKILADRRIYQPVAMLRSGDSIFVATRVAGRSIHEDLEILRFGADLTLAQTGSSEATSLHSWEPTPAGGACLDVTVRSPDTPSRHDPGRFHWCIDPALRSVRRVPLPLEATAVWTRDGALIGHAEQLSSSGYELHVRVPGRPALVIESACRINDELGFLERLARFDKDGMNPAAPLRCDGTSVDIATSIAGAGWKALALRVSADITVSGQLVPIAGESTVLVRILDPGDVDVSVESGCRWPFRLRRGAIAARCPDGLRVFELAR